MLCSVVCWISAVSVFSATVFMFTILSILDPLNEYSCDCRLVNTNGFTLSINTVVFVIVMCFFI